MKSIKECQKTGAQEVLDELDNALRKVTKDLKQIGNTEPEFRVITNEVVMDALLKLINLAPKIKEIGAKAVAAEIVDESAVPKVRNLQDWTLNKTKKA